MQALLRSYVAWQKVLPVCHAFPCMAPGGATKPAM